MSPALGTVGIIGGQFALYGYASALDQVDHQRVVCLKPRGGLSDRQRVLAGDAQWVDNLEELSQRCQTLIMAVPPAAQLSMLETMSDWQIRFDRLILEKPLAPKPESARLALTLAHGLADSVTVGYLFLYTDWFAHLLGGPAQDLRINWSFKRSSAPSTWKSDRTQGGGILAFFAIHLLPVCHALGFTEVAHAAIDMTGTHLHLVCTDRIRERSIAIKVNSDEDDAAFEVWGPSERTFFRAEGPFGAPVVTPSFDYRTVFIARMLRMEAPLSQDALLQSIAGSIDIWAKIDEMVPA